MRNRMLSASGDYTWGNSAQNFYIDVPAAVGQAVQTRLLLWEGEWYLDNQEGTPYLEGIIGKHPQSMADTTIQDRVGGTLNLVDISLFQSSISASRAYSVAMNIDTAFGPTQVQLTNFVNF